MRVVRVVRVAAAVGLVAVLAAGCVKHPVETVVVEQGSPVRAALLSGDGRYVVVDATGAGAMVPGAGWWRVDRDTHDVVQLPPGIPVAISSDASRIQIEEDPTDGASQAGVWVDGGMHVAPPGVLIYDDELRYALQRRATGLWWWDVLAGEERPLDESIQPPQVNNESMVGISEDGATVAFRILDGSTVVYRVAHLEDGTFVDIPLVSGAVGDVELSDSGRGLVVLDRVYASGVLTMGRLRLYDAATGDVHWERELPTDLAAIDVILGEAPSLGLDGISAWVFAYEPTQCRVSPGSTIPCAAASRISVFAGKYPDRSWDLTPTGTFWQPSIQDGGWQLAVSLTSPALSTRETVVLDRLSGDLEALGSTSSSSSVRPVFPLISNSGRIVVTTSEPFSIVRSPDSGWVEYTPEDGE